MFYVVDALLTIMRIAYAIANSLDHMKVISEKYRMIGISNSPPMDVILEIDAPEACEVGYQVFVRLTPLFGSLGPFKGETAYNALQLAVIFVGDLMSGYCKQGVDIQILGRPDDLVTASFQKLEIVC